MFKTWFLAARPKTLLVSVGPVLLGSAYAFYFDRFNWLPAVICLVFALLAQITSNFANDYDDFKKGTDRDDRLGPTRAVASGAITARSMRKATLITIMVALCLGLSLIAYGGWWLILVGLAVAVFAFAYSGGPYPLSYNGLGDVAVLLFYGIVPVVFSYYVQALDFPILVIIGSVAVGLVGVNVLIVNNYRDMESDQLSDKRTTVVMFGRRTMAVVYAANYFVAYLLGFFAVKTDPQVWLIASIPYAILSIILYFRLTTLSGIALNKVLGITAFNVLLYSISLSIVLFIS